MDVEEPEVTRLLSILLERSSEVDGITILRLLAKMDECSGHYTGSRCLLRQHAVDHLGCALRMLHGRQCNAWRANDEYGLACALAVAIGIGLDTPEIQQAAQVCDPMNLRIVIGYHVAENCRFRKGPFPIK